MSWKFGQYLQDLLDKKEWNMSRLAKETGLSHVYVGWLINGQTSGKPNPPKPSLDTLILLSETLNVSPMKLLAAYQGKDPNSIEETDEDIEDLLAKALEQVQRKK